MRHYSWENNDGGGGEVTVQEGKIELQLSKELALPRNLPFKLHFLFCYQCLELLLLGFSLFRYRFEQVPSTNGLEKRYHQRRSWLR